MFISHLVILNIRKFNLLSETFHTKTVRRLKRYLVALLILNLVICGLSYGTNSCLNWSDK